MFTPRFQLCSHTTQNSCLVSWITVHACLPLDSNFARTRRKILASYLGLQCMHVYPSIPTLLAHDAKFLPRILDYSACMFTPRFQLCSHTTQNSCLVSWITVHACLPLDSNFARTRRKILASYLGLQCMH